VYKETGLPNVELKITKHVNCVALYVKNRFVKELHNLYSSLIIRMMKSRRMRWLWHVARLRGMRNAYKIFLRNPEG
jgi:hypothetical protein